MTVYHFHRWHGDELVEDLEGLACENLEAAHAMAINDARDILAGGIKDGRIDLNQRVELFDDAGNLCRVIPFSEAVLIIAPSSAEAPPMHLHHATGQAMHALIIEDEALVAMEIEAVLRDIGYQTFAMAETEEEAVVEASNRWPDLIVSDVSLAIGNGIDAVRRISSNRHIAIVFVTGSANQVRERFLTTVVVEKPFRPLELIAGVVGARSAMIDEERHRTSRSA